MAISDILSEAREDILDYLEAGLYEGEACPKMPAKAEHVRYLKEPDAGRCRADVAAVVLAMDKLRLSPGFDLLPGATPLNFPDDATEYLDALLAERASAPTERVARAARGDAAEVVDDGSVYVGRDPQWDALCEQHGRKDAP